MLVSHPYRRATLLRQLEETIIYVKMASLYAGAVYTRGFIMGKDFMINVFDYMTRACSCVLESNVSLDRHDLLGRVVSQSAC